MGRREGEKVGDEIDREVGEIQREEEEKNKWEKFFSTLKKDEGKRCEEDEVGEEMKREMGGGGG